MLTIRKEQYAILAAASREEFLCHMERHVREHFQPVIESLSKDQLREVIERNLTHAEGYGLKSELGVCSYLNAVFTLGEEFEKQPSYPWAAPLFQSDRGEREKLDFLKDRINAVLGELK